MKMKKVLTLVLVVAVIATLGITLFACNGLGNKNEIELPDYEGIVAEDYSSLTIPADFKFGLITLHDETSTYDKNFIDAAKEAAKALGLAESQLIIKSGIDASADCTIAAEQLVAQGCKVIMADSFGHEAFLYPVALANPSVQFCHATGVNATTYGLSNFQNAFASIYEGRYLAGIAAGMKLNEMIKAGKITAEQAKMGYVGAYTYAEVISGYTSFYLGAKSVCPSVTMDVQFTGSWYDVVAEKTAAEALIARGCVLISQHADSMGAPSACEAANVPDVSYNGSTIEACPNTFIVSSRIDWTPYMKHIIAKTIKGEDIETNYVGTLATGSVKLTNLNKNVVGKDVKDAIVAARTKLANGTLNVFDTNNFTVNGVKVSTHIVNGQNVIENGIFKESKVQSAPYFDLRIDGITALNEKF